jgi:hypothetical protein
MGQIINIKTKMNRNYLVNMYNATSTDDGTGNDELETYEAWLERQLISRIKKIDELEDHPEAFALPYIDIKIISRILSSNLQEGKIDMISTNISQIITEMIDENDKKKAKLHPEKKSNRKGIVFDFVVKHKTDCYRAFKICADHKGFNTPEGSKLIELARKEIGYSRKTWDGDIYHALWRVYKGITVDGANTPEEIK